MNFGTDMRTTAPRLTTKFAAWLHVICVVDGIACAEVAVTIIKARDAAGVLMGDRSLSNGTGTNRT